MDRLGVRGPEGSWNQSGGQWSGASSRVALGAGAWAAAEVAERRAGGRAAKSAPCALFRSLARSPACLLACVRAARAGS